MVRFRRRKGLAAAFAAGIDAALKLGADYIVNTDADNQYAGGDIPLLLAPLLAGEADICIGDRNIQAIAHMSASKKLLQRLGSWVVRQVSGTQVPDTTSGFRAYTRDAALRMTIISEFSYTLESIIQAGKRRMAVAHVEVRTNAATRDSRLFDSVFAYIKRSAATIVRIYASYEPLKVFSYIGGAFLARRPPDLAALPLLLLERQRLREAAVADPRRGAAHRRLPGAPDRARRRPHLRQPQDPRGRAVPRPQAGGGRPRRRRAGTTAADAERTLVGTATRHG